MDDPTALPFPKPSSQKLTHQGTISEYSCLSSRSGTSTAGYLENTETLSWRSENRTSNSSFRLGTS